MSETLEKREGLTGPCLPINKLTDHAGGLVPPHEIKAVRFHLMNCPHCSFAVDSIKEATGDPEKIRQITNTFKSMGEMPSPGEFE